MVLIFKVVWCGVAGASERQSFVPAGVDGEEVADLGEGLSLVLLGDLADDLVVDVEDDVVSAEGDGFHDLRQAVPGCGLDDVLGELPAVGLYPAPFVRGLVEAVVLEAGVSEAVCRGLDVWVADESSAGQLDGHRLALHFELEGSDVGGGLGDDALLGGVLDLAPELDDLRVGCAPFAYRVRLLLLGHALALASHGVEGAHASAVAEGQDGDLAFLSELGVGAVLLDRDVEHLGGGLAVDVLAGPEGVEHPVFSCDPSEDSSLDGAEVANDEGLALRGHEGCADELGEGIAFLLSLFP